LMGNVFYEPGPQRAAKVRALFDKIAVRYDLLNDLQSLGLHRWWKRRVIQLARPQPGHLALDICCGTGDLAQSLSKHGVRAVGLDFAPEMLAVAAQRNHSSGTSRNIQYLRADAQQLPFRDNSFDVVTVGYGLRNLSDWELGLREMQRVARPRGRLLVLEFGKPENAIWRSVYFAYLRMFVPLLGRIFCGDAAAYAYILESLQHYPAQQTVAAKMCQLGLVESRVVNLLGGVMSINYGEKV